MPPVETDGRLRAAMMQPGLSKQTSDSQGFIFDLTYGHICIFISDYFYS